ncbi:MAG: HNH endonuclease [Acidimicrobiaceae bacterium]|nr:HNH endonuclease [Acidimicrobiaceae bacterium]
MVIELVERVEAAVSELLAELRRGRASSEELVAVLAATRPVRGKFDAVQAFAASAVAASRGHGDGGTHVLAETTGASRQEAFGHISTAQAIAAAPAVRDAVESGRVAPANARRLAEALKKTSAEDVERDPDLLSKAESLSPERFAKEARRWAVDRQGDGGESEYRRQRARRSVRMWDGDDGMMHLIGQFDPVTGRRIANRLNREARRLRDAHRQEFGTGRRPTPEQCMADALDNLTAGSITAGSGRPFADIALVARLDADAEKLMVSTADGEALPSSVVERLACGSSWFALVLSSKGVPMWKGRNVRRATDSQFQALLALYGGCAGCGEPDRLKIQAHHMDPFALGGCTDLDNLLPLCWGCHDKVHEHGWRITGRGDGLRTIKPPDRVHHGPARIPEAVPLFAAAAPAPDTDADTPGRSRDRGARAAPAEPAGRSGHRAARAALNDARAGPAPSRSRAASAESAGRSGPRAARAALSAARANRDVATAPYA